MIPRKEYQIIGHEFLIGVSWAPSMDDVFEVIDRDLEIITIRSSRGMEFTYLFPVVVELVKQGSWIWRAHAAS